MLATPITLTNPCRALRTGPRPDTGRQPKRAFVHGSTGIDLRAYVHTLGWRSGPLQIVEKMGEMRSHIAKLGGISVMLKCLDIETMLQVGGKRQPASA